MQKIVINKCYGGFGLSKFARTVLGTEDSIVDRAEPELVALLEKEGSDTVSGAWSLTDLQIVEIPEGVDWQIEEYDGNEWVSEKHRTWR